MGTSISSPMPADPPFNVYRNQLSYLPHGLALWNPETRVTIGDVGYFFEGTFIRLFNVLLPFHHISNRRPFCPPYYKPLDRDLLDIPRSYFTRAQYYSHNVSTVTKAGINMQPMTPDK